MDQLVFKMSPDKVFQEMKSILEKEHGREFTSDEVNSALTTLKFFAKITVDNFQEELRREHLLKESPKGFHLDIKGTCSICDNVTSKESSWYDKFGLKCMTCQDAINKKVIPASIGNNKESWYSKYELQSYFNINSKELRRYMKESFLKERVILDATKKVHLQLFLMKDNKDVLPPKKLLKSRIGKAVHKGEEYFAQEQWYEFVDEKLFKQLRKYKIVNCFKDTFAKPITGGGFLFKEINPLFGSFK